MVDVINRCVLDALDARSQDPQQRRQLLVPLHHASLASRRARRQERKKALADGFSQGESRPELLMRARALHHDMTHATRRDDLMHPARDKACPRGGSSWKTWTPLAMLQVTFDQLSRSLRDIAKSRRGAHGHVAGIRQAVANSYVDLQGQKVSGLCDGSTPDKPDWLIVQHIWDETKMACKPWQEVAGSHSVVSQHGMLYWSDCNGVDHQQELIYAPAVVQGTTADDLFSAITARQLVPFEHLAGGAHLCCYQPCSDSVSANIKVVKYINETLPPGILILWGRCLQHQCAIALAAMTKYLNIVGNMFCVVKVLYSGQHMRELLAAIAIIIEQRFEWLPGQEPEEADVLRVRKLCAVCHLKVFAKDGADTSGIKVKEADDLCSMFTSDVRCWKKIRHKCRGCCASRDEALAKTIAAYTAPLKRRLHTPAINRWGTVAPVVVTLLSLLSFHGIIAQAELRLIGKDPSNFAPEESDADDEADLAAHRVGQDQTMRSQRLQARRRLKRAREWLVDPVTQQCLMIWACVGQQAMRVHFHLFASGSINQSSVDNETDEPKKPALFQLCGMRESRALEVIGILSRSFFAWAPAAAAIWGLAESFHGPMSHWSHDMCRRVTTTVNRVIGNLWRRFYVRLRSWPWRLVRYCDDQLPYEDRVRIAEEFLAAPWCCLDAYFGRRFRAMVRTTADMFLEPVVAFVKECFMRCLASTTHVENQFAHIRS